MDGGGSLWVLGHRIRLLETDDSYGLVEVTSLPGVPGPPPHHHEAREFFLVLDGTLDVMTDGVWRKMSAGEFTELPPGSLHTFINSTARDVVWLTGWRPKGFQRFFRDFGISVTEADAQARSVSEPLLQRVAADAEGYGMYIRKS
jgi:mannose-6-phosphate isomerase-like protein (cupin superfamily)